MGKFSDKKGMGLTPFSNWRVYALEKIFHPPLTLSRCASYHFAIIGKPCSAKGMVEVRGREGTASEVLLLQKFSCVPSPDDSLALTRSKTLSVVIWLR
ncbi:hypothetical protein TNCT_364481 [Trichonephila clavata]|uniref:Uncharacterized protein n=1 Tax=Trichonephila clavata TaxID=2740835 RepID=A0A8X6L4N2_TRICU|nr:hypothetical protein TNCT_364481 [Trichonephila clavata]